MGTGIGGEGRDWDTELATGTLRTGTMTGDWDTGMGDKDTELRTVL